MESWNVAHQRIAGAERVSTSSRAGGWGGRLLRWPVVAVVVVLVLVLVVRACTHNPSAARFHRETSRDLLILRGDWTLTEMSVDGRDFDVSSVDLVDLSLDATSLQGWSGCQGYAAMYSATALGALSVDGLGLSENSCEPEAAELSEAYLRSFSEITTWSLTDDAVLHLRGTGITLTYTREVEPSPSADELAVSPWVGTWKIRSLRSPTHDTTIPAGDELWIGIGALRTTGFGGCNTFFGRVITMGARGLEFERLVIGLKTCHGSAAVMRQERQMMDVLANVERWETDDEGALYLQGHGRTAILDRIGPPPAVDSPIPV
jgi:heat shock protein HslJ